MLSSNISSTCPHNIVNFGLLAAEIVSLVWCPANFNGFHVLAVLLHRTLVVLITGSIVRSATRRYLSYPEFNFEVFHPARATHCTDGGKIWHGGGDRRSVSKRSTCLSLPCAQLEMELTIYAKVKLSLNSKGVRLHVSLKMNRSPCLLLVQR